MNWWLLFFLIGLFTMLERLSFILFLQNWEMPDWLKKALTYVPVVILSALAAPAIFLINGELVGNVFEPKVLAGITGIIAAYFTRNMVITIVSGMVVLWTAGALVG
ncbi:MAG: AzlD domain-containing protein [Calditrichia bacterium]